MAPFWRSLPPALARRLLINATGQAHLLACASLAMQMAEANQPNLTGLTGLAAELLVAAWMADPLHGPTARHVAALPPVFIHPELAKAAKIIAATFRPPDRTARLEALEAAGDWDAMRIMVERELSLAPGNCFWRWHGWHHGLARIGGVDGDTGQALAWEILEGLKAFPPLAPVGKWLEAQFELCTGRTSAAVGLLERHADVLGPWHLERLARARVAEGNQTAAIQALLTLLRQQPWRINALLTVRDLQHGLAGAVSIPQSSTAICLYSFNKAEELQATLASLAASERGGAIIRILDNGSTDATPEVCAAWQARLGEACTVIRLPVNVGAAPARNWLLALPEVQACEFVAFLDDDVELPAEWLGRLHAGLAAFPTAGVAGARVLEDASPGLVQQVEQFFQEDAAFAMADVHRHALDLGQFTYCRPCLSVTGCCHLFRRAALAAVPAFDIRYSPTQYDDVDHDFALTKAGFPALYQGHLAIRHKKRSGRGLLASAAESANAAANFHKLAGKWSGNKAALQQQALAWSAALVGLAVADQSAFS
ncbi:putative glycosyl transferase 2 family protein [Megalodesulfovibrio gigas DSM 1382 = ATCC 19364]|uniref:Putative glycosyl transferase 2 family protein n=2 Tax=Megalodesulfovibrio gigas TaxID=879 RepID=T2GDZ1_MEGG1|nr:putative glycosyl transferase 2 family protein [Megalodesulfovibrio gigas DSM 1382 = ATCC 19364]